MNITDQNRKWWVLASMCCMVVLLNIDFTAVNLALAPIAKSLHASLSNIEWVVNIYILVIAATMILGGRLGDLFGYKRFYMIGTSIFVVTSCLAALSVNMPMLIASRALQGIGVALAFPATTALIFAAFPVSERGKAMGIFMAMVGVSQAIGPTLGGVLIELYSWRAVFFINVPICLVSLVMTYYVVVELPKTAKEKLDLVGIAMLVLGLSTLITSLNEGHNWGIGSVKFLALLFFSLLTLIVFVIHQKKIKTPTIDLTLFKNATFSGINAIRFCFNLVFMVVLFILPLMLQNIIGYSPLQAGVLLLAMTILTGCAAPIGGRLVDRLGSRLTIISGLSALVVALVIFSKITLQSSDFYFIIGLMFAGIGFGLTMPSTTYTGISSVPEKRRGIASGIIYTNANIGSALGVALTGFVVAILTHNMIANFIKHSTVSLTSGQMQLFTKTAQGIQSAKNLAASLTSHGDQIVLQAKMTFMHAFQYVMLMSLAFVLLAIVVAFFTIKQKNLNITEQSNS